MEQVTSYLAARPLRAIVLVALFSNVRWQASILNALRAQTRFWGGSGSIILPCTPQFADEPLFWALVEAQDPDAVVMHPGTFAELESLEPELYEDREAAQRSELVGRFSKQAIDAYIERWRDEPLVNASLDEVISSEIVRRVAPLHHDHRAEIEGAGLTVAPGFPFTDAFNFVELPGQVVVPTTTGGDTDALQLAAEAGGLSSTQIEALKARGVVVDERALDRSATRDFVFTPDREPVVLPLSLSEKGLAWFSTSPLPPSRLVLVVGDDPWDFALFYALRRLGGLAYWLPSDYVGDRSAVIQLMLALSKLNADEVAITTARSPAQIQPAHDAIAAYPGRGVSKLTEIEWQQAMPLSPRRLLLRDSYGVPQPLLLDGDQRSGHLPTPIPSARVAPEHETRWMAEVRIDKWQPILNPHLGPHLIESNSYGTFVTRTTKEAVAYFCPHFMWFGGDLEGQTVRPRFRRLSLFEQVSAILAESNWTCAPSDKGIYAEASMRLFGGFEQLAAALSDPIWNSAFRALMGSAEIGLALKDKRRYLALTDLLTAVGGAWAEADVQRAVTQGVLARGLVHKCPVCRWASWYEQAELGGDLRCGRCRTPTSVADDDWLGIGEPTWFYRLAEVLWQFLDANGDLPIRGLMQELRCQDAVMDATPELDLRSPDSDSPIEIDMCVQRGHQLWIGEAKVGNRLGAGQDETAKIQKLADAARVLGAHGVLFVTAASGFQSTTLERIRQAFPGASPLARIASTPPVPAVAGSASGVTEEPKQAE